MISRHPASTCGSVSRPCPGLAGARPGRKLLAAEVACAIHGFNALEPGGKIPRPDLLIVARGGGSLEDLWSFNEEIVVRAASESLIPADFGGRSRNRLDPRVDHAADMRARRLLTAAAELERAGAFPNCSRAARGPRWAGTRRRDAASGAAGAAAICARWPVRFLRAKRLLAGPRQRLGSRRRARR